MIAGTPAPSYAYYDGLHGRHRLVIAERLSPGVPHPDVTCIWIGGPSPTPRDAPRPPPPSRLDPSSDRRTELAARLLRAPPHR